MVFGLDDLAFGMMGSAAIGGVASWLGGEGDFEDNQKLMREQNAFNAQQSQQQMQFQERMSSTAYQRSRADMEKAGINPMLMMNQGGASSPAGASAQGAAAPQTHYRENALANIVTSARDTLATMASVDKMRADTKVSDTQATVNAVMADKVVQDTKTGGATAKNLEVQNNLLKAQAELAKKDAWKAGKINEGFKVIDNIIERARGNTGVSAKQKMMQNQPQGYLRER